MDEEERKEVVERDTHPPGSVQQIQRRDPADSGFLGDPSAEMGRGEPGASTTQSDVDGTVSYPGGDERAGETDETSMEPR